MSDRRRIALRLVPVALVALLALAMVVPTPPGLELGGGDQARADELEALLDGLPAGLSVLVGFDPDLGTYAEIRPTVRALLSDLVGREAALAVVSLTPEGRALAVAERARLERAGLEADRVRDLGFRPGAEAAIVALVRDPAIGPGTGPAAAPVAAAPVAAGIDAFDLVVVVGGNDIGPRTWVEQLGTRVPGMPLVAVAPTMSHPELRPYLDTGQVDALLATVQDGAAYRATVSIGGPQGVEEEHEPSALPFLVGMLVAIGALAQALIARASGRSRPVGWDGA